MIDDLLDISQILENLTEDCSLKIKTELEDVISKLNKIIDNEEEKPIDTEDLIKIQDHLEQISTMNNVEPFVRNEIYNVLSIIETLI